MNDEKKLVAAYDATVCAYAAVLQQAAEADDAGDYGYELIEASATVIESREGLLANGAGWIMEYVAVSSRFLATLVDHVNGKADLAAVGAATEAYVKTRDRYFDDHELEIAA